MITPLSSTRVRCFLFLLNILLVPMFLSGCSSNKSPETITETFIEKTEKALEERKLRALRALISEEYLDQQRRAKQDIVAVAASYLLRNKRIFLLSRLQSATEQEGKIKATVLTAMAGSPIHDPTLLPTLQADIYFFDIVLREEDGDWKLVSATWRQAMIDDFLSD